MLKMRAVAWACAVLALAAPAGRAGETSGRTVESAYPGLATGVLTHARLGSLPDGTLLRAGTVEIKLSGVDDRIARAPAALREELRKNAFFLLEQISLEDLLLLAARREPARKRENLSKSEREVIREYLGGITSKVEVSDADVAEFYAKNAQMFCGAELDQVKAQLKQYLVQEREAEAVDGHVKALGRVVPVTVSASWVKDKAALARDNPVDRARLSGKPALVAFGGASCCGPDKMVPVISAVRESHGERVKVVYVEARERQVLAARYGIRSIPSQIFFDAQGRETFRHSGVLSQEEIEKRLDSTTRR